MFIFGFLLVLPCLTLSDGLKCTVATKGYCLAMVKGPGLTWTASRDYCQKNRMALATIHNDAEAQVFKEAINKMFEKGHCTTKNYCFWNINGYRTSKTSNADSFVVVPERPATLADTYLFTNMPVKRSTNGENVYLMQFDEEKLSLVLIKESTAWQTVCTKYGKSKQCTYFESSINYCVHFNEEGLSLEAASKLCSSLGMELAVIRNKDEYDAVVKGIHAHYPKDFCKPNTAPHCFWWVNGNGPSKSSKQSDMTLQPSRPLSLGFSYFATKGRNEFKKNEVLPSYAVVTFDEVQLTAASTNGKDVFSFACSKGRLGSGNSE